MADKKKKFYITTAIDYVNASPHLGHAYEKIAADCIARWHKLLGEDVFFLTGTDENAQKNVKAAKKAKIAIKQFVDSNAKLFIKLCKKLQISNDDFIRTIEERHKKVAQQIFELLHKKDLIYKGNYEGLYCTGCEAFKTEKELVTGKCPEHPNLQLELLKEEAYFFKLSLYQDRITQLLEKKYFVVPEAKRKEMLSRIKEQGLKDLCVSRKNLKWGIPVPFDKEHTIYVWIDALTNYISALEYPKGKYKKYWPADVHVIGKDINWFHSVIWPSLLIAADIEIPKTILVHGFINIKGEKISKTTGLVIDPFSITESYGVDSFRYFLLREIPFGQDGDFNEKALVARHNNELADKLGNLVSRTAGLTEKQNTKVKQVKQGQANKTLFKKLKLKEIQKHMQDYELDKALHKIFDFIDDCNAYIQEKKPWQEKDKEKLNNILYSVSDSTRIIAILLWPFIPETAEKIAKQFEFEIKSFDDCKPSLLKLSKIKKAPILFKKIGLEDGLKKATKSGELKKGLRKGL